jgi:hypothetical protein
MIVQYGVSWPVTYCEGQRVIELTRDAVPPPRNGVHSADASATASYTQLSWFPYLSKMSSSCLLIALVDGVGVEYP